MIKTFFTKIEDGIMGDPVNRRNFLRKVGLETKKDILMHQEHGDTIALVDETYTKENADAMISSRKDIALFTYVADCLPILLYDEEKEIIGIIHGGREPLFKRIAEKVVDKMIQVFNIEPSSLKVIVGPSIRSCCYEVSEEMVQFVLDEFGSENVEGKNINLQEILKKQLLNKGVEEENIQFSNICTMCSGEAYYSFRKDKKLRTNFAGVISVK